MAGPLDPFNPGPTADPIASLPNADTFSQIKSQWDTFLGSPGGMTALLQFGINMSQPPHFGDTTMSMLGRAVGGAGEAVTRQQELERKDRESESRIELQEARAERARMGAEHAGAIRDYKGRELDLKQQAIDQRKESSRLQANYNALRMYNKYRQDVAQRNADAEKEWNDPVAAATRPKGAVKPPQERVMSESEFYVSPLGQSMMQGVLGPGGGGTVGIGAPTATPPSGTRGGGVRLNPNQPFTTDGSYPRAERNKLVPDMIYETDKGPLRWNGRKFEDL